MSDIDPRELKPVFDKVERVLDDAVDTAYTEGVRVIGDAYTKGVEYGNRDLKPRGVMRIPPAIEELEFLKGYNLDLLTGLSDDLKKEIKRVIRDGLINGKGVQEVAKDLREALDLRKWRINTIARTEIMRAANYGRYSAWNRSGVVKGKEWLTAFDDRTCDICAALDGERRRLDEQFSVGVLMPPAHPNCRCTAVPIFLDEKLAEKTKPDPREIPTKSLELKYSRIILSAFRDAVKEVVDEVKIRWGA